MRLKLQQMQVRLTLKQADSLMGCQVFVAQIENIKGSLLLRTFCPGSTSKLSQIEKIILPV
jgi:hypothetical protein